MAELTIFDADEEIVGYKEESKIDPSIDYVGVLNLVVVYGGKLLLLKENGKFTASAKAFLKKKEKYSDVAIKLLKQNFNLEEGILRFTGKFRQDGKFLYYYIFLPDTELKSKEFYKKEEVESLDLEPYFAQFFAKYHDMI